MDLHNFAQMHDQAPLPESHQPGLEITPKRIPLASNPTALSNVRVELRAFYGAIGVLLLIPLVGGLVGAFGGLEGLASLFGVDGQIVIATSLRNSLRAICIGFFAWVPLIIWSLAALPERAGAFRIIVACGFLAGFARLTGCLVEGYPGVVPLLIMTLEFAGMPILLLWHARLVRLSRSAQ